MRQIFNINNFLYIFFIFLYLNYCFFLYRIIQRTNPFIVGDWFINYENGIVRRGLFGEIFFWFADKFNFQILIILFILIALFAFIFFFLTIKIIKQSKINLIYLLLILSPLTFLFNFYDPLTIGRKEILFFVFFTFYIYKINNELSFSQKHHFLIFFLVGLFLALTHELVFFYMFFPLFIKFLILPKKKDIYHLCKSELFFIFGCLLGLLIIIYSSASLDPNTPKMICDKIISYNINEIVCHGPINLAVLEFFEVISYTINHAKNYNYYNYIFYYLIFVFSILIIFSLVNITSEKNKILYFFIFNVFQILMLCLLFVIVNDWGRYLNIYFIFNSFILIKFFNFKLKETSLIGNSIIIVLIILNLSLWHMPHCCNKNFGNGFFSLKERIDIRIKSSNGYEDKTRELLLKVLNKFNIR